MPKKIIKKIKLRKVEPEYQAIEPAIEPEYQAILEMAGNKYTGTGRTLFEAMDALKLEWHDIKAKGVFTIIYGDKSVIKLFYLKQLKRIFANKIVKQFWAKNLEKLMKII